LNDILRIIRDINHFLIRSSVYEDVAKNFESWTSSGLKLYIFSSGSVEAQKLLFANTTDDDLSKHLTGYYDTKIGPKQESDSYQKIAKEIGFKEDEIVFFTDVVKEAEAAKKAGYKVALLDRPGNAEIDEESKKTYSVLKTFDDVKLTAQTAAKRKNEEVTEEQVIFKPKKRGS
jgi:enolase-phosphatase E1